MADTAPDQISETITIPLSSDMLPSQIARAVRSMANIGHAIIANAARAAAVRERPDIAGLGAPVYQQIVSATANLDAAASGIEQGQRSAIMGGQLPPPPGMARA